MVIVFTIAGFLFLGLASLMWRSYQADKNDFTDFDWPDVDEEPAPVPVAVKRDKASNVVTMSERRK